MSAKLKSLERSLGLVPKTSQPMSDNMQRIARQQDRQAPAPVSDQGLGATIEAAVDQAVQQRVGVALAEQRQQLMREFNRPAPTDYRQLPPVQTTTPKKSFDMLIHRDGAGQILWMEMDDGTKVELVRDRAGKTVAMREITDSPVQSPLDIPFKAEARQYRAPGKIYGNHLVDQDEN